MLLKWWKGNWVAIITGAVVVKGIYYFISTQMQGQEWQLEVKRTRKANYQRQRRNFNSKT